MELSLLNLLFVLVTAWAAGRVAYKLGYPSVLGELLAGILLGPPLLGVLHGGAGLEVLAEVGILLMMLYIGMEIDPRDLGRASKAGLLAAFGGFITPFVLCYLVIVGTGGTVMAGIFVGLAAGVTSLATKSRILVDLNLLDTRIALVMMAGALVADTLSLVIFAAVIGIGEAGSVDVADLLLVAAKALAFFAAAGLIGWKGLPWLGRRLQQGQGDLGRTSSFMLILIVAFAFAEGAELAGLHGILGTFIAGLFLREQVFGRSLSHEIMHLVRDASIGFLAPVFFVTAGFAVSLDVFTTDLGLLAAVIGLATVGKIVGTALFYLPTGHGWREGVTVGAGMNGRGAVEIIVAQIGLSLGLITAEIFSILVFMAILTTATVPVLLKWGTDWLRRRGELVRAEDHRRGALIVGAGPTARALGRILARSMPVQVVDRNREHCARAEADGLETRCGNALDEQVLDDAGAGHVRHLLALTPNAEVNALIAQRARTVFGVPEVHVLQHGDRGGHDVLLEHLGATTLFGGAVALADWDYWIDHNRVERTGLPLTRDFTPGALYASLQEHRPSLPLAVRRGDDYEPFHHGLTLESDDRVIVLQTAQSLDAALDQFDRLVARCPVLDLDRSMTMPEFFDLVAGVLAPRLGLSSEDLGRRLHDREDANSTVLMPGLAIPHVVVEGEGRFEMVLARCRDGIPFPDQPEPVHAVFVLLGAEDQRTFHLRALSAIAQIVSRPDFEVRWLTAPDVEALRRLVLYADRRRFPDTAPPGPGNTTPKTADA